MAAASPRRALVLASFLAALAFPAGATATPPAVVATASPSTGVGPVAVTLSATGDPASYSWDLGDGTAATGATVRYFLRGFAIHGYPSVPAYPASHGCVRVPMWIAPQLFAGHPYGATVTIYL